MNEQDILDMAFRDRVRVLNQELQNNTPQRKYDDISKKIKLALEITNNLPQDQQYIINDMLMWYIPNLDDIKLAMYKGGLLDGIRITKDLQRQLFSAEAEAKYREEYGEDEEDSS